MPRLMYDSVNASSIKKVEPNPQMVAGYDDTIVIPQWTPADWALFPNAVKVKVVKKATSNWGHVLDVEPGDATPAQAPGWVSRRRKSGLATPTVYCNLSTWQSVIDQFNSQGVTQPLYWIAKYDDQPGFVSKAGITCIAKQYHGNDPRNYDLSYVADFWPGVDGNQAMAFDNNDFGVLMYANKLQEFGNFSQLLEYLKLTAKGTATAVAGLKDLIIADDANDVTAEAVANALKDLIQSELVPAVVASVDQALTDLEVKVDNQALSATILDNLRSRLEM